ncbi:hypothetical protein [Aquipuribacter hungaricus]|uniref:Uncharacterized protein n=1 Tax=Aquipuribacter hungaricus TaxID=545624 RepID=A0ABV7WD42_9MICO
MHPTVWRACLRLVAACALALPVVVALPGTATVPPASAAPLTCPDLDLRTAADLRPRQGVITQYLFESTPPVVDFTAYRPQTVTNDGRVIPFGPPGPYGQPIVGAWQNSAACDGSEYPRNSRTALADGRVFASGDIYEGAPAEYLGDVLDIRMPYPLVGMNVTSTGDGYHLLAADGGVFTFGDAPFHGSTGSLRLNRPVVGMSATTDLGYWLVAADGGVFTFGDARFHGSTGALRLQAPIIGMAPTPTGGGYWLVASDGGVFTFGDARFRGSLGGTVLGSPVRGLVPSGDGYVLFTDTGHHVF